MSKLYVICINVFMKVVIKISGAPSQPFNFTYISGRETASSIMLAWVSSFHGGANQTFHIFFKTNSSAWMEGPELFGGQRTKERFTVTVQNLLSGTSYFFLIMVKNVYGTNNKTAIISATTKEYIPGKFWLAPVEILHCV